MEAYNTVVEFITKALDCSPEFASGLLFVLIICLILKIIF
jgi:hypothetical protein